ncbi:MAG TPA: hypothetical protein PLX56_09320, partial [bacterium]|nr:hypothetical protein [bacterium]
MGSGFFSGLSKILKKNVKDVVNTESLKNLGKLANTDVSDLVGDVKAASLLSQIEKNPEKVENY